MNLEEFAEKYKVRIKSDGCRDKVIPGKFGHVYTHSPSVLGVCLEWPIASKQGVRSQRFKMRQLGGVGLLKRQEGDGEGTWLIPSEIADHRKILKILKIRKIRTVTGRPFAKKVE